MINSEFGELTNLLVLKSSTKFCVILSFDDQQKVDLVAHAVKKWASCCSTVTNFFSLKMGIKLNPELGPFVSSQAQYLEHIPFLSNSQDFILSRWSQGNHLVQLFFSLDCKLYAHIWFGFFSSCGASIDSVSTTKPAYVLDLIELLN